MTGPRPGAAGSPPSRDPGHRELRERLGAYVLGHLTAAQRAEVDAHLGGCAACRAELADLRPVARVLAAGDRPPAPDVPVPARALGARIDSAVREESRRRRLRSGLRVGLAAAAVVLLALLGAVGIDWLRPATDGGPGPIASGGPRTTASATPSGSASAPLGVAQPVPVQVRRPRVSATAGLVAHTWGTEIRLVASGLADRGTYRVTVLGRDGTRFAAGAFLGTGARPVTCSLNAAVLAPATRGFEVVDADGAVVLRSDFP